MPDHNSSPNQQHPLYITIGQSGRWHAWATDVPMKLLVAKDRAEAIQEGRAIAEATGREWGGHRLTPKQRKRKNRKQRTRKRKAAEAMDSNRERSEFQRGRWANRAKWTNEDWEEYLAGVATTDEVESELRNLLNLS